MALKIYSLWLVPSGAEADILTGIVRDLVGIFGGCEFQPHVTILDRIGGEESALVSATERIATQHHPLQLRLESLEGVDVWHRFLYLTVARTEELHRLRESAIQEFADETPVEYFPHLSLMYGTRGESVRQRAAKRVKHAEGLALSLGELCLVDTRGPIQGWRAVGTRPLIG